MLPTAVGISYISCVVGELLLASVVLLASLLDFWLLPHMYKNLCVRLLVYTKPTYTIPHLYRTHLYNTSSLQHLICTKFELTTLTKLEKKFHFLVFETCYIPRHAGIAVVLWVTLDQWAYGQLTKCNPTDFAAPNRLILLPLLRDALKKKIIISGTRPNNI